jgi:hypothetical protein
MNRQLFSILVSSVLPLAAMPAQNLVRDLTPATASTVGGNPGTRRDLQTASPTSRPPISTAASSGAPTAPTSARSGCATSIRVPPARTRSC